MKLREVLWIVLLVGCLIYIFYPKKDTVFDEDLHKRKLDSLQLIIDNNKIFNDSLNKYNLRINSDITKLNESLKDMTKRYKTYEQLYKKSVGALDSMSDNDISTLFTNTFK